MAAEEHDIEIWRRVDAAMEALPRPDRGRLARIEQGLPWGHRGGRHRWWRGLVGAGLGLALVAAAAAYWTRSGGPETGKPGPGAAPEAVNGAEHPVTAPRESGPPADRGGEAAGGDDRMIYQR